MIKLCKISAFSAKQPEPYKDKKTGEEKYRYPMGIKIDDSDTWINGTLWSEQDASLFKPDAQLVLELYRDDYGPKFKLGKQQDRIEVKLDLILEKLSK